MYSLSWPPEAAWGPRQRRRITRASGEDLTVCVVEPALLLFLIGEGARGRELLLALVDGGGWHPTPSVWGDAPVSGALAGAGFTDSLTGEPLTEDALRRPFEDELRRFRLDRWRLSDPSGFAHIDEFRRGSRLLRERRPEEAAQAYGAALAADPPRWFAEELAAWCAEIHAQLGDRDRAAEFVGRWWHTGADRQVQIGRFFLLPGLAAMAAGGTFRSLLHVSDEQLDADIELLTSALATRLSAAPVDPAEAWDWARIFAALRNRTGPETDVWEHPGADDASIRATETRVGMSLPTTYREFLRHTNGAEFSAQEQLWPCERIGLLRDLDPELVEILAENDAPMAADHLTYSEQQEDYYGPHARDALVIGQTDAGYTLLNPAVVDASGEYEAWYYAPWIPGVEREPTFKRMVLREYLRRFD